VRGSSVLDGRWVASSLCKLPFAETYFTAFTVVLLGEVMPLNVFHFINKTECGT
jgi:hypothetical protein